MAGLPESHASLLRTRRGYLATGSVDGGPQVVPVCFTWAGDVIWTAIDGKPKKTEHLQRLKNIEANPKVAFIVDRWEEDWSRLAWLSAKGTATVIKKGAESLKAIAALKSKYSQYAETPLEGPVIRIDVERWSGWSAEDDS